MTAKEFFDLVSDMRSKQREYFRSQFTARVQFLNGLLYNVRREPPELEKSAEAMPEVVQQGF